MGMDIKHEDAQIAVNELKALYMQVRSSEMLSLEQYMKVNITEEFWKGLMNGIEHREIINVAIS